MANDASPPAGQNIPQKKISSPKPWQIRFLLPLFSIFLGGLIGFLLWAASQRDPTPRLEQSLFDDARARWQQAGIKDYTIEIKVEGSQPATYQVWVENGIAVRATRNQNPLTQRRTFETWSVPGMFGTIDRDLQQNKRTPGEQRLVLRAQFDPQNGVPLRYNRLAYQGGGDVLWNVTKWERTTPAAK